MINISNYIFMISSPKTYLFLNFLISKPSDKNKHSPALQTNIMHPLIIMTGLCFFGIFIHNWYNVKYIFDQIWLLADDTILFVNDRHIAETVLHSVKKKLHSCMFEFSLLFIMKQFSMINIPESAQFTL